MKGMGTFSCTNVAKQGEQLSVIRAYVDPKKDCLFFVL